MTNFNFHDQGVTDFSVKDNNLHFGVECYDDSGEISKNIHIVFHNLRDVHIKGDLTGSATLAFLHDDGEILKCDIKDHNAHLVINWQNFKTKERQIVVYQFGFDKLETKSSSI